MRAPFGLDRHWRGTICTPCRWRRQISRPAQLCANARADGRHAPRCGDRRRLHRPAAHDIDMTVTSPAVTAAGIILGTAADMAPEQAKGARSRHVAHHRQARWVARQATPRHSGIVPSATCIHARALARALLSSSCESPTSLSDQTRARSKTSPTACPTLAQSLRPARSSTRGRYLVTSTPAGTRVAVRTPSESQPCRVALSAGRRQVLHARHWMCASGNAAR